MWNDTESFFLRSNRSSSYDIVNVTWSETILHYLINSLPLLQALGLGVCAVSVLLNAWIFFILRRLRASDSSIYNLSLIRHLLLTDAITAVLIIVDLGFIRGRVFYPVSSELTSVGDESNFKNRNSTSTSTSNSTSTSDEAWLLASSGDAVFNSSSSWGQNLQHRRFVNDIGDMLVKSRPEVFNCHAYTIDMSIHLAHALTLLTLTLIAVDLYMFITRALSYRTSFVVRHKRKLLAAIWATSALVILLPAAYHAFLTAIMVPWEEALSQYANGVAHSTSPPFCYRSSTSVRLFCCVGIYTREFNCSHILLAILAASCLIVTFCYARIVCTIGHLMRISQERESAAAAAAAAAASTDAPSLHHNRRGVVTSVSILLLFYALFLPYFILNMHRFMIDMVVTSWANSLMIQVWNLVLLEYTEVTMVTYTLLHPLVYACRLSAVRRHSTRTLALVRQRTRDSVQRLLLRRNSSTGGCGKRPAGSRGAAAVRMDREVQMRALRHQHRVNGRGRDVSHQV